jgi:predicted hydrocarbon binding protein
MPESLAHKSLYQLFTYIGFRKDEDLDCSGLPITNETICNYDEGFIAGILNAYTGKTYEVRELDCWANGDRVCRFHGTVVQ